MNTRSFAQSTPKLSSSASLQPYAQLACRLACGPAIVLQAWWQAETGRRRRLKLTRELSAMSLHTLRDIGVSRFGTDWVARHDP